jgi:hypothetical protein
MTHRAAAIAFLLIACASDSPAPEAAASGISQVGDTTIVTTAAPGLDGIVSLTERWHLAPDTERLGEVTGGVLGALGDVWFAVTGGTDRAVIYRGGRTTSLRAIADLGTDPGALTGDIALGALANGGIIAVERASGRAIRFDSLGSPTDTFAVAPLMDGQRIVPDRDGGWFAPSGTPDAWLHYSAGGLVTDTLRPSAGWGSNAAIGIARDGSWLRAIAGSSQLVRRAGDGPMLTAQWIGDPLQGTLHVSQDANGLAWVGARGSDGVVTLRSFDRDAGLRFIVTTPSGTTLLDQNGEYLLLLDTGGGLRLMEIVPQIP